MIVKIVSGGVVFALVCREGAISGGKDIAVCVYLELLCSVIEHTFVLRDGFDLFFNT
ncbi:hypothetical protein [Photorhabdus caribbeanensis]|uniref:hypothetical protein n=1 Tax=Photorhabdus caribbeanensis TaxID=1004165 RepID=UPI001BD391ED|nr:hypothetical protein [Photorhabdus caribbeanensis]